MKIDILIIAQYEEKKDSGRWAPKGATYHKIQMDSDTFAYGLNYEVDKVAKDFLINNDMCRETVVEAIPMFSFTEHGDVTDKVNILLEERMGI